MNCSLLSENLRGKIEQQKRTKTSHRIMRTKTSTDDTFEAMVQHSWEGVILVGNLILLTLKNSCTRKHPPGNEGLNVVKDFPVT